MRVCLGHWHFIKFRTKTKATGAINDPAASGGILNTIQNAYANALK
jgi:hypothetical protein